MRLYYRAAISDTKHGGAMVDPYQGIIGAMAESNDGGRTFFRPNLDFYEFDGSKKNNIVWRGGVPGLPGAFIDTNPACPPAARYKGLDGNPEPPQPKLYAMASADGLRWHTMRKEPLAIQGVTPYAFDSIICAFWDAPRAVIACIVGEPAGVFLKRPNRRGARSNVNFRDFIHWTPLVPLQYVDGIGDLQLYECNVLPCPGADTRFAGFSQSVCRESDEVFRILVGGVNDALFMASRDRIHWTLYREAWVRPGLDQRNWTHRNNYPTWHIIQTSPEEWSILISEHYMQKDSSPVRLRRLSIRPWGFVSVHAGFGGGEMVTQPLVFKGKSLHLNYSTSAIGSIQIELQNENGQTLSGFALNDMTPLFGDDLDGSITWGKSGDLSRFVGRPVRLRFLLKDADVFSMCFSN